MTPVSLIIDHPGSFNTDSQILQHHFCSHVDGVQFGIRIFRKASFIPKIAFKGRYQAGFMDLNFNYEWLWWLKSCQILEYLVNSKRSPFFLPS